MVLEFVGSRPCNALIIYDGDENSRIQNLHWCASCGVIAVGDVWGVCWYSWELITAMH